MSFCKPAAWLLVPLLLAPSLSARAQSISIATWGGAHAALQARTLAAPFHRRSGIQVDLLGVDVEQRARALFANDPTWDAVSLPIEVLEPACVQGRLRPLAPSLAGDAPDGTPPDQDFLPGLLHACGIGEALWSMVVAYDAGAFADDPPARIGDLFDPLAFPGGRALYRHPRGLFEWALLADGVPGERVYAELATAAGIDRALAMLDRIRDRILWWSEPQQAADWLQSGEASMAAVFSDDFLLRQGGAPVDFPILWDGHLWRASYWAIPTDSAAAEEAARFIAFSSSTRVQAERARYAPQGPARRSAVLAFNSPLAPHLPSWPDHFERGLRWDVGWWVDQGEQARARFGQWLAAAGGAEAGVETETVPDNVAGETAIPVDAGPVPSAQWPATAR